MAVEMMMSSIGGAVTVLDKAKVSSHGASSHISIVESLCLSFPPSFSIQCSMY